MIRLHGGADLADMWGGQTEFEWAVTLCDEGGLWDIIGAGHTAAEAVADARGTLRTWRGTTYKETTMGTTTTADTLTDEQIGDLYNEAIAAGDYLMADICQRALSTDTVDQDGNTIACADWTRDEARAEVARVIADADAQVSR